MKSFIQFISEAPLELAPVEDETPTKNRPILGKSVKKFAMSMGGILKIIKPKKIGSIKTDSGNYTFHHHSFVDPDPFNRVKQHHIYIADNTGTIVGVVKGSSKFKSKTDANIEHIGIDTAAIDTAHRGKGLYAHSIRKFVDKFPHIVYSDNAQTTPARKAWEDLASTSEKHGHEVRVHPFMTNVPNEGIPVQGKLNPGYWEGGETPRGFVKPEEILFSIRKKK